MSQGRCAGCGETGPVKRVRGHAAGCPAYALLCQEHPDRALDPAAEFARWHAEDRQAERAERRSSAIAGNVARREQQAGRYARLPDPLED